MNSVDNVSPVARLPAAQRSARTNGRRSFVSGDGRTPWARRWRDLCALYITDAGGEAALSEFQLGLISTAASLRCEMEKLEGRLSLGEPVDLDGFGRLAGHFRRICQTIGITRAPPRVATLAEHLAKRAADQQGDVA